MPRFKDSEEYENWKAERLKNPPGPEEPGEPTEPVRKSDNIIKISIAVGILIISISVGYYYLTYLPKLNAQKELEQSELKAKTLLEAEAENKKQKEEEFVRKSNEEEKRKHSEREAAWVREELVETRLETERLKQETLREETLCTKKAWASYYEVWNSKCKEIGLKDSCSLPDDISQIYSDERKKALDECYK